MDMRTLKTKITKVLKQNNIKKVVIHKSGQVRGWQSILYSGFGYTGDEIRWYSVTRGESKAEQERHIKAIYDCLSANGFATNVEIRHVGLGEVPVIQLKAGVQA